MWIHIKTKAPSQHGQILSTGSITWALLVICLRPPPVPSLPVAEDAPPDFGPEETRAATLLSHPQRDTGGAADALSHCQEGPCTAWQPSLGPFAVGVLLPPLCRRRNTRPQTHVACGTSPKVADWVFSQRRGPRPVQEPQLASTPTVTWCRPCFCARAFPVPRFCFFHLKQNAWR